MGRVARGQDQRRPIRVQRSPIRRAARLVLVAGLALVATEVLRGYQSGALTPARFVAGEVPPMNLIPPVAGLVLTLLVWLALRASGIAAEAATSSEREARELLALQARRFHALEREGWDGVMIVDSLGVIRWMGVTAAKMLHLSPDEVVGQTILSLVHFSDVDGFLAALSVEEDDSWKFEFRIIGADDRERWFEGVMSNHVDDEAVSGVVLHFRDTTDWHAVEQTIRDRDDHVRAAFDHSPFGAAIVDADGELRSVSMALAAMVDKDASTLVGRRIGALLSPRDRSAVHGAIRRMKTGDDEPLERDVALANGSIAVLALTPIPGPPHEVRSYLLQVVWRAYAGAPPEFAEESDGIEEDDFELTAEEEDDIDVIAEEAAAAFAEIGAPRQGWADEIVDLDIELDEEGDAAQDDAAQDDAEPNDGPAAEPPAPLPPTAIANPILRTIANAHRADRTRDEQPDDAPPDVAVSI